MLTVFGAALLVALGSLLGGILLLHFQLLYKWRDFLLSFSAGALLAAASGEFLPTAMQRGQDAHQVALFFLLGFLFLPLLTLFSGSEAKQQKIKGMLLVLSDSIHNFADGVAIAAAFLFGASHGWWLSLTILLHELPQEVGEFYLLSQAGYSSRRIIALNWRSSLTTVLGAALFYYWGSGGDATYIVMMAALSAGYFFYLVAADLLPVILTTTPKRLVLAKAATLGLTLLGLWLTLSLFHQH